MKHIKTFEGSYEETTKKYNADDLVMYKDFTTNGITYKLIATAQIGKVISIDWNGDIFVKRITDDLELRLGYTDIIRKVEEWELDAKKYNL